MSKNKSSQMVYQKENKPKKKVLTRFCWVLCELSKISYINEKWLQKVKIKEKQKLVVLAANYKKMITKKDC